MIEQEIPAKFYRSLSFCHNGSHRFITVQELYDYTERIAKLATDNAKKAAGDFEAGKAELEALRSFKNEADAAFLRIANGDWSKGSAKQIAQKFVSDAKQSCKSTDKPNTQLNAE